MNKFNEKSQANFSVTNQNVLIFVEGENEQNSNNVKKKRETKRERVVKLIESGMSKAEIMDIENILEGSYYNYKTIYNKMKNLTDSRLHKTLKNQDTEKDLVISKPMFNAKAFKNVSFLTVNGKPSMLLEVSDSYIRYLALEGGGMTSQRSVHVSDVIKNQECIKLFIQ
jgi:DNA-binding CsgD family transcriptional regulator